LNTDVQIRLENIAMRKRKKKVLDKGKEARRAARQSGIAPSATRVIADKRKRPPKHSKKWLDPEAS
jgi:hypothetical protein